MATRKQEKQIEKQYKGWIHLCSSKFQKHQRERMMFRRVPLKFNARKIIKKMRTWLLYTYT